MKNFKKTFILIILTLLPYTFIDAQSYAKYMQEGKVFYNKSEYMTSLERFDLAYDFAANETEKKEAKSWRTKSREKIKQQQIELNKALSIAENEKRRAENEKSRAELALQKVKDLKRQMEIAIFDKAIKERNTDWKGYTKYDNEADKQDILEKIDSLDLSFNALNKIPKEITECKNLESINLIGNSLISSNEAFNTLSTLNRLNDIKISVFEIDSINPAFYKKVTGIDYSKNDLSYNLSTLLPELIKFENLEYLDLSYIKCDSMTTGFEKLDKLEFLSLLIFSEGEIPESIYKLQNLKRLQLYKVFAPIMVEDPENPDQFLEKYVLGPIPSFISDKVCKLKGLEEIEISKDTIPDCFYELKNLKKIEIYDNSYISADTIIEIKNINKIAQFKHIEKLTIRRRLKTLPVDIYRIQNLKYLDLSDNQLQVLPPEIALLTNITSIKLNNNQLQTLPKEIGKLTKLKHLELMENRLPDSEKQKIKNLLPNCDIKF